MESSDVIPRPMTRRPLVPGEADAERELPLLLLFDLLLELPEERLEFPDDLLELPRPPLALLPPLLPFGM